MAMEGAICGKSRTWRMSHVVFTWLQSGRKSSIFVPKAKRPASVQSSSSLRITLQHVCTDSWPICLGSTGRKPTSPPKPVNMHVNFHKVSVQIMLFQPSQ